MNVYQRETIDYYNKNASLFCADTAEVEFSSLQNAFMVKLPTGGRILDLGCGSGRDSKAFLSQGFDVVAIDASTELCGLAKQNAGIPVTCATFEDFQPVGTFDGVWACSSLLHVPKIELPAIIKKYSGSLNPGGIFYMSFKLGDHEGMRNGRFFTDLDEDSFRKLIESVDDLGIASLTITHDARPKRAHEKWLNAFCIKESARPSRA